ncbi:Stress response protein nst1 like [Verticillium longisporum]|uniref:Stress response protein nst1 like n=1 Tax=Verticillium longisporum TaxID=100787 RepID=A0A8I2Z6K4_VERLO|nr:Stress response protein nst1 like [Verticillium longisporum]
MDLGGILTVADDLLKNDGKRFIEMMEQLAERRMAREEDARDARAFGHPAANGTYGGHTHPPPEDEYDDEDEDDDEYDDDNKAALKKQALAEDKARREAAKAAEEAARLEEQQRRAEEQRQKAEEKRRKKDEQKRLEEEDRQRKEAERQRRAQEQIDKRAEQDRKVREAKEKEKRLKDDARLRDKEVKEQREREQREKKERLEQEKLDREAKARTDREAKAKVDKDVQDRRKQDEKATQKTAALAAAAAAAPTPAQAPARRASHNLVPVPAALPQHPPNQASFASPKIAVATPALPKAPTPIRPKNAPQSQDVSTGSSVVGSHASQAGSAPSQNPSPHSATPAHPSPHPFIAQRKGSGVPPLQPQSVSPPHAKGPNAGPFGMPPGISHPPAFPMPPPGLAHRPPPHDPMFAQFGGFRPPPGFSQPFGEPMPPNGPPHVSHTRQSSGGFESGPSMASQPIGRPAPIGRPGSVVHGQGSDQVDDVSDQHLGSSALLDDSEEPIRAATARQLHQAPGPGPRQAFPSTPFGMDAGMHLQSNPWSNPSPFAAFGPPPGLGGPNWGNPLAAIPPMPSLANLRTGGNPRSVAVRRMLCRVCKELQGRGADGTDGFADLNIIMSEVEQLNRMEGVSREVISESEILDLAETEGTPHNGGGVFDIRKDVRGPGKHAVRWVPDLVGDMAQPPRAVGEIGSPVIGTGHPAFPMRGS